MAFVRELTHKRKSGKEVTYIQIVHSYRDGKRIRHKVLGTLGRKEQLLKSGSLERMAYKLLEIAGKLEEFQKPEEEYAEPLFGGYKRDGQGAFIQVSLEEGRVR